MKKITVRLNGPHGRMAELEAASVTWTTAAEETLRTSSGIALPLPDTLIVDVALTPLGAEELAGRMTEEPSAEEEPGR